ncbi:MAG TPA: EamA family transporter [Caldilineae bacterium]|nr:EamA family transporter [Caldilineae bacterium]
MPEQPSSSRSLALVLLAAMLWGTIGVVAKELYASSDVGPLALSLFRLGVAAPLLGLLSFARDGRGFWRVGRADWAWWLAAAGSMAGYQLAIFAAVQRTSVTAAQFLAICTAPILVAAAAPPILGERLTSRTLVAGGLALAGVSLVIGWGNPGDLVRSEFLLGNLFALTAAGAWAAYAIIARRLVAQHSVTQITFVTFTGAALLILPWALPQTRTLTLTPAGWAMAFYLGAMATALAYVLYVSGLQRVTATASVFLALAEPATAAMLAAWRFHERLSLQGWLGVGLLILGLLWLIRAEQTAA